MKEYRAPINFTAMGRDYLAQADAISEKVAQLKREYKHTHDDLIKVQIENWKEIECDLRHQGLDFIRRGERRRKQGKEDF